MAERTGIEWTDSTWNPLQGTRGKWHCVKVSPACKNCYAETLNRRFGGPRYQPGADEVTLSARQLAMPLRLQRAIGKPRKHPVRRGHMVFTCSMTDLHGEFVPLELRAAIHGVMTLCPDLIFQTLTKRPEERLRFRRYVTATAWRRGVSVVRVLRDALIAAAPNAPHLRAAVESTPEPDRPFGNVWEGVTVESDATADRIEELPDDAAVRMISAEPLLGWLTLPGYVQGDRWWVIAGGESGAGARPTHPWWIAHLREQCADRGVPFFFKQWGEWQPASSWGDPVATHALHCDAPERGERLTLGATTEPGPLVKLNRIRSDHTCPGEEWAAMHRPGKRAAGALLNGREHKQFPAVLPSGEGVPY